MKLNGFVTLALLFTLFVGIVPHAVDASITYTENFDNDATGGVATGTNPTESWYTFHKATGTCTQSITTVSPISGTKSFRVQSTAANQCGAPDFAFTSPSAFTSISFKWGLGATRGTEDFIFNGDVTNPVFFRATSTKLCVFTGGSNSGCNSPAVTIKTIANTALTVNMHVNFNWAAHTFTVTDVDTSTTTSAITLGGTFINALAYFYDSGADNTVSGDVRFDDISAVRPSAATTIHITKPTQGQVLPPGDVIAAATIIDDPDGVIDHIMFNADGTPGGFSCTVNVFVGPPGPDGYSCTITGVPASDDYAMFAYAYDSTGGLTGSTDNLPTFIVTSAPVVHVTNAEGSHYPRGDVSVHATLSDPDTETDHIHFALGGSYQCDADVVGFVGPPPPTGYACTIPNVASGTYVVTATPRNNVGGVIGTADNAPHIIVDAVTGITFSNSTAVSDAVGLSVDPGGNTAITRQASGETVITYAGGGAMPLLGSEPTFCERTHGVFSAGSHVLYFQCSLGDPNVLDSYRIRGPGLGAPSQPNVCNGTGFCVINIQDESSFGSGALAGNHDNDRHVAGVYDFPITYANNQDGFADDDVVWMAFAFSTTDGAIGVVTYVMRNNAVDTSNIATVGVSSQLVDDMCMVEDTTGATRGQSFLYGASSVTNVEGYRVTFDAGSFQFLQTHSLHPTLTQVFPGTALTAQARGVGCGDGHLSIATADTLTLWLRGSLTPYATISLPHLPDSGGVKESADGRWTFVSMNQASIINVYDNLHGGNLTMTLTNPSVSIGNFEGMDAQGHGCSLWTLNQQLLVRYNLVGATRLCATDMGYLVPASGSGGNTASTNAGGSASGGGNIVAGSGCSQTYTGPIRIGYTYVPIADWSNCASMITETASTILLLFLIVLFVMNRLNRNKAPEETTGINGPLVGVCCFSLGFLISVFVWQAPFLIIVPVVAVSVAIVGFRARRAVA